MQESLIQKIEAISAEMEIRNLVHACTRAVDRGDVECLKAAFHPDAVAEYGFNPSKTVSEFLTRYEQQIPTVWDVQHNLTTSVIRIEGDYAEGESYVIAYHLFEEGGTTKCLAIGGRYLDKYERRGGVWKISHRIGIEDWSVKAPAPATRGDGLVGEIPKGGRGSSDPTFEFFRLIK